jgi:hypothetical protein
MVRPKIHCYFDWNPRKCSAALWGGGAVKTFYIDPHVPMHVRSVGGGEKMKTNTLFIAALRGGEGPLSDLIAQGSVWTVRWAQTHS